MHLATLDEEVLDDIEEDPEGDEPQAEAGTRGIDLQRPRRVVECLIPLTRETLATGRVSVEPMDQVRGHAGGEEANETPATNSSDPVQVSGLSVPRPWLSSVQFVQETYKEIQWLIPGVLPAGAVVLLSGKAGTMKSFLALSMASAVASGTLWLGRPTKQGPALYVDGENPPSLLQDRLRGIGTAEGLNIWSLSDETFPQSLKYPDLQRAGTMHSLIVVDTLRRQMGTLQEDRADDMAQVTKDLKELARCGATILVLHHAPKNPTKTGPRGPII